VQLPVRNGIFTNHTIDTVNGDTGKPQSEFQSPTRRYKEQGSLLATYLTLERAEKKRREKRETKTKKKGVPDILVLSTGIRSFSKARVGRTVARSMRKQMGEILPPGKGGALDR